jgi:hypothetical protein
MIKKPSYAIVPLKQQYTPGFIHILHYYAKGKEE